MSVHPSKLVKPAAPKTWAAFRRLAKASPLSVLIDGLLGPKLTAKMSPESVAEAQRLLAVASYTSKVHAALAIVEHAVGDLLVSEVGQTGDEHLQEALYDSLHPAENVLLDVLERLAKNIALLEMNAAWKANEAFEAYCSSRD